MVFKDPSNLNKCPFLQRSFASISGEFLKEVPTLRCSTNKSQAFKMFPLLKPSKCQRKSEIFNSTVFLKI